MSLAPGSNAAPPAAFDGPENPDQANRPPPHGLIISNQIHGGSIMNNNNIFNNYSHFNINNINNTNNSFNSEIVYNYESTDVLTLPPDTEPIAGGVGKQRDEAMPEITTVLGMQVLCGAMHYAQPGSASCLEFTRETVMHSLMSWVIDGQTKIFWLVGMAGTGKTSIAITVSRMLLNDPNVILGGTFFFSRSASSASRTKAQYVVPTLAASLAAHVPDFAAALTAELEKDVHIVAHYAVRDQIAAFLEGPLAAVSPSSRPIVFIIDALDECDDEKEAADLLASIADFKSAANVKFILLSCPGMYTRCTPISSRSHMTILELDEIDDKEVSEDIRQYIAGTLQRDIRREGWYSDDNIKTLVKLSQGLFILASTLLRYILSGEEVEGRKTRLQKVISVPNGSPAKMGTLYQIYAMIVREAWQNGRVDKTRRVIACILASRTPLSVKALADLLFLNFGELREALERLRAVVHVPKDNSAGLRTLHASFGEYMLSEEAPNDVHIATSDGDEELARGCLYVMAKNLRLRPTDSENHWDNITLSLDYSCRQWIHHVRRLPNGSTLQEGIKNINRLRRSFWEEVVSVSTSVGPAAALLLGGPV